MYITTSFIKTEERGLKPIFGLLYEINNLESYLKIACPKYEVTSFEDIEKVFRAVYLLNKDFKKYFSNERITRIKVEIKKLRSFKVTPLVIEQLESTVAYILYKNM